MNKLPVKMRQVFAEIIRQEMSTNKNIVIISGDLGYKMWDRIRKDYPDRFINVGAAEQVMMGIAVGLALEGKIPIVYSITTFLLYRPFETIRNYINYEKIPVKLIGSGRNKDYSHDGISHWAEEDKQIMKIFSNISSHWPENTDSLSDLIKEMLENKKPYYINLTR